jgi:hypothetical protein
MLESHEGHLKGDALPPAHSEAEAIPADLDELIGCSLEPGGQIDARPYSG